MKRIVIAAALVIVGLTGAASAQGVGIYVGTDHPYYWHRHHHWRDAYAYDRDCRVVVRTHINRWGHRVTVRERSCD